MFCKKCGKDNSEGTAFCIACGDNLNTAPAPQRQPASQASYPPGYTPKSKTVALCLALIPGILLCLPVHRFYMGKVGTNIIMITLGILFWVNYWLFWIFIWFYGIGLIFSYCFLFSIAVFIWMIMDCVNITNGKLTDAAGYPCV